MVTKHPLSESEENAICTADFLQKQWREISRSLESCIPGQWSNQAMVDLANYISNSKTSQSLYPGISMGTLLISKPVNQKLNFQKTLAISYLKNGKNHLSYTDYNVIENKDDWKKTILWEKECDEKNLEKTFLEFITWKKNW